MNLRKLVNIAAFMGCEALISLGVPTIRCCNRKLPKISADSYESPICDAILSGIGNFPARSLLRISTADAKNEYLLHSAATGKMLE